MGDGEQGGLKARRYDHGSEQRQGPLRFALMTEAKNVPIRADEGSGWSTEAEWPAPATDETAAWAARTTAIGMPVGAAPTGMPIILDVVIEGGAEGEVTDGAFAVAEVRATILGGL